MGAPDPKLRRGAFPAAEARRGLALAAAGLPGLLPGGAGPLDPLALAAWLALVAAPAGVLAGAALVERGAAALPAALLAPLAFGALLAATAAGDGGAGRLPSPGAAGLAVGGLYALGAGLGGCWAYPLLRLRGRGGAGTVLGEPFSGARQPASAVSPSPGTRTAPPASPRHGAIPDSLVAALAPARAWRAAGLVALAALTLALLPTGGGALARPFPPAAAAVLLDLSPLSFVLERAGLDFMRHPAVYGPAGSASIGPELRGAGSGALAPALLAVVGCALLAAARGVRRARMLRGTGNE